MSQRNRYRKRINEPGFVMELVSGECDAWEVLLSYVRLRVTYSYTAKGRRPPPDLSLETAIEEYTQESCTLIAEKLKGFLGEGRLSGYLDRLIQTAMADRNFKNTRDALTRFLKGADKLCPAHYPELVQIIRNRPRVEGQMLLACMRGERADPAHWGLWCDARLGLLRDPDFSHLLHVMAKEGISEARTILFWQGLLTRPGSARLDSAEENGEQPGIMDLVADPGLTPYETCLIRERREALLECLQRLRSKSKKNYLAVVLWHLWEEPYEEIATILGASSQGAVRQRVTRGLKLLRKCLDRQDLLSGSR